MKSRNYYFEFDYTKPRRQSYIFDDLCEKIDNVPMTKQERHDAEVQLQIEAKNIHEEERRKLHAKVRARHEEFWEDARKEFGYGKDLSPAGVEKIEAFINNSYELTESTFDDIIIMITDLTNLLDNLRPEIIEAHERREMFKSA